MTGNKANEQRRHVLIQARIRQGWSQAELAEQAGVSAKTVARWETGNTTPQPAYRAKLATLLQLNPEELWPVQEHLSVLPDPGDPLAVLLAREVQRSLALPAIWNVPFAQNPFFTGREELLEQLAVSFQVDQTLALSQPQAISGLGGMGKTQLALEYAYQAHQSYEAVLWARAENTEALVSSYIAIAALLQLPESKDKEQKVTIQAVKNWLQTHRNWLLILDNADELPLLLDFLPPSRGGHLLLTTRAAATGRLARRLEIGILQPPQGALFLLRRASLLELDATLEQASQEDQQMARLISQELDGLPLALDQAGAYLEETGTDLTTYWQIYQQHQTDLLQQRRGLVDDHPAPVATTWSLSFQKMEARNPVAADLLRVCAYLSPDAIPEEIFTTAASMLGPRLALLAGDSFQFNQAIEALRTYSLIRRNAKEKTLSIHRLVQAVLKERMDRETQTTWAERTLEAVNAIFPSGTPDTWEACQRYFSHVQSCVQLIKHYALLSSPGASLLNRAGYYLFKRNLYEQAQPLFEQALTMRENLPEPEHLDIAETLLNLGMLYSERGTPTVSSSFLQRARAIYEEPEVNPHHSRLAEVLIHLGYCHQDRSQWDEAEAFYQRALGFYQLRDGASSLTVATSLNVLAEFYDNRGRYQEAEQLFQRTLAIRSAFLKADDPDLGETFHNLGLIYHRLGRYQEAKSFYQQALVISEKVVGPVHRNTAVHLQCLGTLYHTLGHLEEAESAIQRALQIRQNLLGQHSDTALTMNHLALVYRTQGRYGEAEALLRQALPMQELHMGAEHMLTSVSINNLGLLLSDLGQQVEAEKCLKHALTIRERELGPQHTLVSNPLHALANLYLKQGKCVEAELLFQRALHIRKQQLGPQHPDTAEIIHDLAQFREIQGNYIAARVWYTRTLEIRAKALGPNHPKTEQTSKHLLRLIQATGQSEEIVPTGETPIEPSTAEDYPEKEEQA